MECGFKEAAEKLSFASQVLSSSVLSVQNCTGQATDRSILRVSCSIIVSSQPRHERWRPRWRQSVASGCRTWWYVGKDVPSIADVHDNWMCAWHYRKRNNRTLRSRCSALFGIWNSEISVHGPDGSWNRSTSAHGDYSSLFVVMQVAERRSIVVTAGPCSDFRILYIIFPIICLCALTLYPPTDCAAATDISGVSGRCQLSR